MISRLWVECSTSGEIQTLDLKIVSQVFYHCATGVLTAFLKTDGKTHIKNATERKREREREREYVTESMRERE